MGRGTTGGGPVIVQADFVAITGFENRQRWQRDSRPRAIVDATESQQSSPT
jgi:hypothetical protein